VHGTLPTPAGVHALRRQYAVRERRSAASRSTSSTAARIKRLSDHIMQTMGTQRFSARIFIPAHHWDHQHGAVFSSRSTSGNAIEIFDPTRAT
jgi:hypothetical protein